MKPTRSAPAAGHSRRARARLGRTAARARRARPRRARRALARGPLCRRGGPGAPRAVERDPVGDRVPARCASRPSVAVAASGCRLRTPPTRGPPTPRDATADDPVYLNEATVDDLRRLPGIGPKRALAVLALRQRLGRFRQVEDLLRVRGIGRSTLRRLRPLVRLDHPPAGDGGAP